MKSTACKLLVAVALIGALSACHTIRQETAMEWMQRQPIFLDP